MSWKMSQNYALKNMSRKMSWKMKMSWENVSEIPGQKFWPEKQAKISGQNFWPEIKFGLQMNWPTELYFRNWFSGQILPRGSGRSVRDLPVPTDVRHSRIDFPLNRVGVPVQVSSGPPPHLLLLSHGSVILLPAQLLGGKTAGSQVPARKVSNTFF